MDFIYPTCNESMSRDLLVVMSHTEEHIIDVVKKNHPAWIEKNGLCKRCYEHYKKQLHPDA